MKNLFSFKTSLPDASHAAFLERIKDSLIPEVKESLFAGMSKGLLDVVGEVKGGVIRLRVVDLTAKGPGGGHGGSLFDDMTTDEFYNVVSEDEFMSRVVDAAKRITPRLYDMFREAEKAFGT